MSIIIYIQSFHNPVLDILFQGITMLGEEYFPIILTALILWCINKELGYKIGLAFLSGQIINSAVKNIFCEARPIGIKEIRSLRLSTATGYSFPSGHSQNSGTIWTLLMQKVKKRWFYIFGTLIMLLVGLSRLYLGVHWPQDVVFGLIIGILWALFCGYVFDYVQKTNKPHMLLLIVIPALLGMLVNLSQDYSKAAAGLLAFYFGYILESKFVNYQVKANFYKQILKFTIGIALLFCLMITLKKMIPSNIIGQFVVYFSAGLFTTVGAPILFKKLKL